MPGVIQDLPREKQTSAYDLLENLIAEGSTFQAFHASLNAFKQQLIGVTNEGAFFNLVGQIIEEEREVHHALAPLLAGVDAEVLAAVKAHIKDDERFVAISRMLMPEDVLTGDIIAAKEKLTETGVYTRLSTAEKKAEARTFIEQIKGLKLYSALLEHHKMAWIERLASVDSLDEVDACEHAIQQQGDMLANAYKSLVIYPEDEETATELVKYLESNTHLLELMYAFDRFSEALQDDVLAARMRHTENNSLRP